MQGNEEKRRAIDEIESYLAAQRTARPSVAMAAARSPKAAATIAQILAAGHRVFIRDGHAGLSLRKVADEADVAVGNVSYYFETKRALIEAVLCEALADYIEEHIRHFEADRQSPLEILLNVVAFYVSNARTSNALFFHMWGFAASDAAAKALIRKLYRPIGRFIYYLVRAARPDASEARIREIVLQLFSLEEGVKLFIGMGPDDNPALASAEIHIRDLARRIVLSD
ncbi:MAG: helix-turn-helix domain-containing protein [Parvularculaceae bacterium]|nr:helix-turn-helix domain-containing protein [Parvularculaceae bacterium]